jgi:hypothetical protein
MHEDALYFTDYQKSEDGIMYNNLYKLELKSKPFPFQDLMKINADE